MVVDGVFGPGFECYGIPLCSDSLTEKAAGVVCGAEKTVLEKMLIRRYGWRCTGPSPP